MSWCQLMKSGVRGSLLKNTDSQQRMSGPITASTASRMRGWRTSSWAKV